MANDKDFEFEEHAIGDFSLESILAEYKGSAFINGEKKTPKELLNEKAERILMEETEDTVSEPLFQKVSSENTPDKPVAVAAKPEAPVMQERRIEEEAVKLFSPKTRTADVDADETLDNTKVHTDVPEAVQTVAYATDVEESVSKPFIRRQSAAPKKNSEKDNVVLFFENYRAPETDQETIVRDVEKAIEKELGYAQPHEVYTTEDESAPERYGFDEFSEDEIEEEEPNLKEAYSKFAGACNSISMRSIPAAMITIVMVILTWSFEAGHVMPFGIGRAQAGATGLLLICLLLVMLLCVDILIRGFDRLVRGAPNAETLILFSCVFSFITAVYTMRSSAPVILPYCAVSAMTLTFAAFGEKFNLRAIADTLKTASGSSEPYGVLAEYNADLDKSVLKKVYHRTDGFYNNLMHPDISELVYRYAAPVLLAASLLLSLITLIVRGGNGHFLHSVSAAFAAAAPFSVLLTFSVPFSTVAKSVRRSGAAIAGWGGADDICFTDGASITDDDIFPTGTLSLSGMKLFDGTPPEKAIRYTSSLISASGSGLNGLFEEVMKTQGMTSMSRVEDFVCYEGGISALIRGERVATGSGAFMNLLGVRVPDDTNIKSAIYTAVDNRLVAMFTVDYMPINSVQTALISMLKWRIKLFLAVRDFNITPLMIEQKFRVALDGIEYIQTKDSYTISDIHSGKQGRMSAVLTREGLGPFAEAITGGRLLKSAAFVATMVSVASAIIGVLIMFFMFWSGAFVSARPGNLIWFMLAMLAAVLIVCGYVKCKK
ncbi:MAG: hypothetical protein FWC75_03710 [Oscillospiraceae bacterium]|nr:hypothetical protein [Oscillospiraceae bacterium]